VTSSPHDAYEAAKLKRSETQQTQQARTTEQQALPALAEERLRQIKTELEAQTPRGLRLETNFTVAGGMHDRIGVKGLYLKLFEEQDLRAESSINIGSDRSVELTDHTRDAKGHHTNSIITKTNFADLNAELCLKFLSNLITKHIV
jgi:hypothetical protein